MSKQFVIPASDTLARRVAELRATVHSDPKRSKTLYVQIGSSYVDDVVDGLVLGFLRESRKTTPRMRSLVETLAGLIKSVSHGLVGQAFGKISPEVGTKMLAFLEERVVTRGEGFGLAVPIDDATVANIDHTNALAAEGRLGSERAVLLATMKSVINRSIDVHYKTAFGMLELGFLLRKAVDVGHDAMHAGAMSTIEKSITEGDEEELADLASFLARRVVR